MKKKLPIPTQPVSYPVGSFVCSETGFYYILSHSKRLRLISERVLASWCPQRLIETSEIALSDYRISAKMKFRNGSLIHNLADGKIYLIEEGLRRHIVSPEVLDLIGAKLSEAVTVSLAEVNLHSEGEPL